MKEILDRAAESQNGILFRCSYGRASNFAAQVTTINRTLAEESKKVYPPESPQHGVSPYDHIAAIVTDLGLKLVPQANRPLTTNPIYTMRLALKEKRNITLEFKSPNALKSFRSRCYLIRTQDRKVNSKDPFNPMKGKSIYDEITFLLITPTVLELCLTLSDEALVELL